MPVAEVGACESVARRLHGVTCTLDVSRKSLCVYFPYWKISKLMGLMSCELSNNWELCLCISLSFQPHLQYIYILYAV